MGYIFFPLTPALSPGELNVSHIFVARHRGREIPLKASRVWTTPKEQETLQRWYHSARQGDRKWPTDSSVGCKASSRESHQGRKKIKPMVLAKLFRPWRDSVPLPLDPALKRR